MWNMFVFYLVADLILVVVFGFLWNQGSMEMNVSEGNLHIDSMKAGIQACNTGYVDRCGSMDISITQLRIPLLHPTFCE